MSWLRRTGTGRNNIAWGGGSTTSGNYLKRTGNGRNNVAYTQISSNGTHKLLERTSTGRNNIRWNNLTFSFGPSSIAELFTSSRFPSQDKFSYIWVRCYRDGWQTFKTTFSGNSSGIGKPDDSSYDPPDPGIYGQTGNRISISYTGRTTPDGSSPVNVPLTTAEINYIKARKVNIQRMNGNAVDSQTGNMTISSVTDYAGDKVSAWGRSMILIFNTNYQTTLKLDSPYGCRVIFS